MNNITVLIANHNYGQYIEDALNSCINQTVKPFCVMIVDDKSTDFSWSKIKEYIGDYQTKSQNQFEILHSIKDGINFLAVTNPQQRGPSFSRNLGIDITKNFTEFYQILDADDIIYSNKLERLSSKIQESADCGVVYADYDIYNIHSQNTFREFKEPFSKRRLFEECIVHSGAMIRKQALEDCADVFGYYDINLRCAEDYDLWLRISDKYTISHIPETLSLVRVHQNNSTFSVKGEVWQACWNRVNQKLQARLNGHPQ